MSGPQLRRRFGAASRGVKATRRAWLAGAVAALLASCVTASGPGRIGDMQSVMATLGPSSLFAGVDPGDRWLIVGTPSGDTARMATDEGLPVVLITAGSDELILGRRIDQHLLAAPYLTWSWKMSPHPGAYHPVRIAVGFADTSRPLDPRDVTLRDLPDGVRVLELVWNQRALRRGSLDMPNGVVWHDGDLFIAENERILRLPDIDDRLEDPPEPEVIYDALPDEYRSLLETAARAVNTDMLAEYDYKNPTALRELVDSGAQLRRFPDDVLAEAKKRAERALGGRLRRLRACRG